MGHVAKTEPKVEPHSAEKPNMSQDVILILQGFDECVGIFSASCKIIIEKDGKC